MEVEVGEAEEQLSPSNLSRMARMAFWRRLSRLTGRTKVVELLGGGGIGGRRGRLLQRVNEVVGRLSEAESGILGLREEARQLTGSPRLAAEEAEEAEGNFTRVKESAEALVEKLEYDLWKKVISRLSRTI